MILKIGVLAGDRTMVIAALRDDYHELKVHYCSDETEGAVRVVQGRVVVW